MICYLSDLLPLRRHVPELYTLVYDNVALTGPVPEPPNLFSFSIDYRSEFASYNKKKLFIRLIALDFGIATAELAAHKGLGTADASQFDDVVRVNVDILVFQLSPQFICIRPKLNKYI